MGNILETLKIIQYLFLVHHLIGLNNMEKDVYKDSYRLFLEEGVATKKIEEFELSHLLSCSLDSLLKVYYLN